MLKGMYNNINMNFGPVILGLGGLILYKYLNKLDLNELISKRKPLYDSLSQLSILTKKYSNISSIECIENDEEKQKIISKFQTLMKYISEYMQHTSKVVTPEDMRDATAEERREIIGDFGGIKIIMDYLNIFLFQPFNKFNIENLKNERLEEEKEEKQEKEKQEKDNNNNDDDDDDELHKIEDDLIEDEEEEVEEENKSISKYLEKYNETIHFGLNSLYLILKEHCIKKSFSNQGYIPILIDSVLNESIPIEMRTKLARSLRRANYFSYFRKSVTNEVPIGSEGAIYMINKIPKSKIQELVELCSHPNKDFRENMIGVLSHLAHVPSGANLLAEVKAVEKFIFFLGDCKKLTSTPSIFALACILSTGNIKKNFEINKQILFQPELISSISKIKASNELTSKCSKRIMDVMFAITQFISQKKYKKERTKIIQQLLELKVFTKSIFHLIIATNEEARKKARLFREICSKKSFSGKNAKEFQQLIKEVDDTIKDSEERKRQQYIQYQMQQQQMQQRQMQMRYMQ